jgi:hypothetical protein
VEKGLKCASLNADTSANTSSPYSPACSSPRQVSTAKARPPVPLAAIAWQNAK